MGARLVETLDEAQPLRSATEAAQLSDISWLQSQLDGLALSDNWRAVWRACIDHPHARVCEGLSRLEAVIGNPPAAVDDDEIVVFGSRIDVLGRRLDEIWEEIEVAELLLVLAHPEVLFAHYEPHPPISDAWPTWLARRESSARV